MLFMQTLNVDKVCQVRKKKNGTSLFWVDLTSEWYEDATVFRVFIVILGWEQNDFLHCYGNFFLKVAFWKLLDHSYVQSSEAHWKTHCNWIIYKHGSNIHAKIFHQDIGKHHETKIDESTWKKISCTEIQACISTNIAPKQTTLHLFYMLFTLSNLVFKFK